MAKPKSICSVADCGKYCYGRGYCRAHWERWRLHGDPLAGRTPDGEALAWFISVLEADTDDCLNWPYATNRGGYGVVRYEGRTWVVSELVCVKAHGPDVGGNRDAAHSCSNRLCANKRHISWKSRTGNMADAMEIGTVLRGEDVHSAKLRESDVIAIKSMLKSMKHHDIAALFGVTRETITAISMGRSWRWLT